MAPTACTNGMRTRCAQPYYSKKLKCERSAVIIAIFRLKSIVTVALGVLREPIRRRRV
jgi:hypothetical protein